MRNINRRGVRLASMLVAAGLVLSAAPAALAADADDSNGLLTLTDSQAADLSARAQLDPYGDAEGQGHDPQHIGNREDAATAPSTDTTGGSGSGSSLDGATTDEGRLEGHQEVGRGGRLRDGRDRPGVGCER